MYITPRQFLMGAKLFIGTPECDKIFVSTFFGYVKMKLVSMATQNLILKNGGVPTKSIIFQMLLNLKY